MINLLFSSGLKINKKKRWPRLLLIAINILFILAISDKLKRVFPGVYYMILWDRLKLGVDVIK